MVDVESDIKKCTEILNGGGVILYPTDTIWGLGCDARNVTAIDRIFAIKNRPKSKSCIVLVAEARDIYKYVANPMPDIIAILSSFDAPTTVIYPDPLGFPEALLAEDGSLGIRVVNDYLCKSIIKRTGYPIVSTSANISGEPAPGNFTEVSQDIAIAVDYVVHHRRDDTSRSLPSRIVKPGDDGTFSYIR
jgi:L-threonylcarbamoyladenylate synthase